MRSLGSAFLLLRQCIWQHLASSYVPALRNSLQIYVTEIKDKSFTPREVIR
jgi:hypothetical protein